MSEMNLLQLNEWLLEAGFGEVRDSSRLSGGSICDTRLVTTQARHHFVVKSLSGNFLDLFEAEVMGLEAIRETQSLRVPMVHFWTADLLVLEYLEKGVPNADFWRKLALGLAEMHTSIRSNFGFETDNYCGATPQPNQITANGHEFFAEHRLGFQARLAYQNKLIDTKTLDRIVRLAERLPQLIPKLPATLIHGDLWSGNIHCTQDGQPALIDPACYWGWAEADLAMTRLFGGFSEEFYQVYQEAAAIDNDWEDRADLYNLYHLLNHLNLFGLSYHSKMIRVLKKYE